MIMSKNKETILILPNLSYARISHATWQRQDKMEKDIRKARLRLIYNGYPLKNFGVMEGESGFQSWMEESKYYD